MRVFVAIPLDPALQTRAAAVQDQLRTWPMEVSWVKPANLHLTLRFLGEVGAEDIPRVCAAIDPVAAATPAFSCAFTTLGAFPNWQRPRVLWIGPNRDPAPLTTLARRLAESLAESGFPGDDKPFQAHLTLGRVRQADRLKDGKRLAAAVSASLGRQPIGEVVLMKSTLRPQGSIYEPIARFPLR